MLNDLLLDGSHELVLARRRRQLLEQVRALRTVPLDVARLDLLGPRTMSGSAASSTATGRPAL
jgi:hypothetical protein